MAKKAVLIGCNYPGTESELMGCINDVCRMYKCLIEMYGFSEEDITLLVDTDSSYTQPNGRNIRAALTNLVNSAEPGDFLFIHYSGHGTRIPAETDEDDDTGYDECIVPCDLNFITDDEFRELVDKVPKGCQITIVSDSCHSGGLIEETKEQIGESTKKDDGEGEGEGEGEEAEEEGDGDGEAEEEGDGDGEAEEEGDGDGEAEEEGDGETEEEGEGSNYAKNKSLSLLTVIQMLQQKTGKEDIDVGKLRPTLFDMFGEDSSPKVKKFMNIISTLQVAQKFLKLKLENNDEDYAKPAMQTHIEKPEEVYAGAGKRAISHTGILISGCQTDQFSSDYAPDGDASQAYGALTNVILTIIEESDGRVSNHELVTKARALLKEQGFEQRPGLYCSDDHADAPFIC